MDVTEDETGPGEVDPRSGAVQPVNGKDGGEHDNCM